MIKNQYLCQETSWKAALWVGILFLVVGMFGCGRDDLSSLSGRVTVNAQPVEGLMVQFEPLDEQARPSIGTCDANGNYRAMFTRDRAGATVGRNRVSFIAPFDPEKSGPAFNMPANYGEDSTLEYTVTAGRNTDVDFDLDIPEMP